MHLFQHTSDLLTCIIAGLFLLSSLGSMFYFIYFFSNTARKKNSKIQNEPLPPISIIISARDEVDNLRKNLPLILEQDYPEFEVIVVDDCSIDDTQELILELTHTYKNLRSTSIKKDPKFHHGKKLALTIGIKAAVHEHLLFTDADCYPAGSEWIQNIASNYSEKTEIVIAYGAYETKPGFLNKLIRYETVFTAMQFMGFAERGIPFMGVGRNLSYRKSLFFKNKGFASHLSLLSGDDDLFVGETATVSNLAIESNPGSFTISSPKTSFPDWFRQRKRHFTTGSHYKSKISIMLATEFLFRLVFLGSLIYLIIVNYNLPIVLTMLFFTLLVRGIVYKIVLKRLNERYLFLFSLFIEWLIPYIYIFIHLSNLTDKKRNIWN